MKSKLFLLVNTDFFSLSRSIQEEVYRDFFSFVYGIAIYMTRDHASAEDIVQEAFIKTIYHSPPFENEQQLKAWMKVVTKNLTLNVLRKNKKIRNQDDIEDIIDNVMNKHAEPIEKEVEVKMIAENIADGLSEINPDYQKLIELKWKKDKSNKEIAQQLNLTEGAIKQKLHRARKALKKLILKWRFFDE